jgi:hypothetical protein
MMRWLLNVHLFSICSAVLAATSGAVSAASVMPASTPQRGSPTAVTPIPLAFSSGTALPSIASALRSMDQAASTANSAVPAMIATSNATARPEPPAVVVNVDANLRAGPGTAYPIIGAARAGDRLPVAGQAPGVPAGANSVGNVWWQVRPGETVAWIFGGLVIANAGATESPEVQGIPPPPKGEVKAEARSGTNATSTSTSALSLPDLIVLGPETQYPVRARVIRGWDYELVDASSAYDIVVYRDVFGMLAHQIDDENVQRSRRKSRFAQYGPLRISLVDAQPHPNPNCPGWGWAPDRDTFVDPYGMTLNPCRVEHSLFPQGDGAGTTLQIGWGYTAGVTVAVGVAGPHLADVSTTFLAETLPWPATIGPADRPDFNQALYRPLGAAHKEDGRWVWQDAFAQIVPAGR